RDRGPGPAAGDGDRVLAPGRGPLARGAADSPDRLSRGPVRRDPRPTDRDRDREGGQGRVGQGLPPRASSLRARGWPAHVGVRDGGDGSAVAAARLRGAQAGAMTRSGDWRELLREKGYRLTPQRELVLAAVTELEHATPEEVCARVQRTSAAVNISTVYRTLE